MFITIPRHRGTSHWRYVGIILWVVHNRPRTEGNEILHNYQHELGERIFRMYGQCEKHSSLSFDDGEGHNLSSSVLIGVNMIKHEHRVAICC